MDNCNASIFRPQALRRYTERSVEPVFPQLAPPRSFAMLWVLLVGLASFGGLALLCTLPVYVRGVATLSTSIRDQQGRAIAAVFVQDDQLCRLRIGQRVLFKAGSSGAAVSARIVSIYPGALAQQLADDTLDQPASAAPTLAGSEAVALAELDPASTLDNARTRFPGRCEATVEVGSRRVISLFSWGQSNQ
jgi:hypothetical protein